MEVRAVDRQTAEAALGEVADPGEFGDGAVLHTPVLHAAKDLQKHSAPEQRRGMLRPPWWAGASTQYSDSRSRRLRPKTPFHGGMTIVALPLARVWQARRSRGRSTALSMKPESQ